MTAEMTQRYLIVNKLRGFEESEESFLLLNLSDSLVDGFVAVLKGIDLQSGSDDVEGDVAENTGQFCHGGCDHRQQVHVVFPLSFLKYFFPVIVQVFVNDEVDHGWEERGGESRRHSPVQRVVRFVF